LRKSKNRDTSHLLCGEEEKGMCPYSCRGEEFIFVLEGKTEKRSTLIPVSRVMRREGKPGIKNGMFVFTYKWYK
jgi:hypothetical protein